MAQVFPFVLEIIRATGHARFACAIQKFARRTRRRKNVVNNYPLERNNSVEYGFLPAKVHEATDRDYLPRWMHWDDAASTLLGVPSKKDIGIHHLSVTAVGKHRDTAKDQFVVQVIPEMQEELKHKDGKVSRIDKR